MQISQVKFQKQLIFENKIISVEFWKFLLKIFSIIYCTYLNIINNYFTLPKFLTKFYFFYFYINKILLKVNLDKVIIN